MRRRFNEGKYQERIKNNEFKVERRIGKPEDDAIRDFGDIISIGTYCFDAEGNEVVYAHHYESPYGDVLYRDKQTGAVYRDGKIDPKRILEGGVQYHLERPKKRPGDNGEYEIRNG